MNNTDSEKTTKIIDAFITSDTTAETEELFGRWLVDKRHKAEKEKTLFALWNRIPLKTQIKDIKALKKIKLRLGLPIAEPRKRWAATVAAVAIIMITMTGGWYLFDKIISPSKVSESITLVADNFPISQTLPDNTKIILDKYSSIMYSEEKPDEICVDLKGQSSFEVEKKEAGTFTVKTSMLEIRVHGTKFTVREVEGEKYTTVSLERGSIEVKCQADSVIMEPNSILIYDHDTKKIIYDKIGSPAGKTSRLPLNFTRTPLSEILTSISANYGFEIILSGGNFQSDTISVGFDGEESAEDIMFVLQNLSGKFSYTILGNTITVTPN